MLSILLLFEELAFGATVTNLFSPILLLIVLLSFLSFSKLFNFSLNSSACVFLSLSLLKIGFLFWELSFLVLPLIAFLGL
jgi:hypothetical protein